MLHNKKIFFVLAAIAITSAPYIMCMEEINLELKKEELRRLQQNNSIPFRMLANTSEHALTGAIQALSASVSGSVVELVKQELNILYDGRPTTALRLSEIQASLVIINNGVTLLTETQMKELTLINTKLVRQGITPEEKKALEAQIRAVNNVAHDELISLKELRQSLIRDLQDIQKKRNPNFNPSRI